MFSDIDEKSKEPFVNTIIYNSEESAEKEKEIATTID